MTEGLALRRAQIRERRRCGPEARREVRDPERCERLHAKVGAEVGGGPPGREGLWIAEGQGGPGRLQAREKGRVGARRVGQHDLGRTPQERRRQDLGSLPGVLTGPELTGRDIDERHARRVAASGHRQEKVVRGAFEVDRVRERARGDDPDDVASQELLLPARRLELLTHGDLLARVHEAGDVAIGGVVGDARHRRALSRRQGDLEEAGRELGILEKGLVEIAQTEQQDVVGIAPLQVAVLPHHRREVVAISHGAGP